MKLPRIESLIILVFFGCVVLWGVSKCSSRRADLVRRVREVTDDDGEDRPVRRDTIRLPAPQIADQPVNTQTPGQQSVSTTVAPPPVPAGTTASPVVIPGTKPARPSISNQTQSATPTASSGTKYSTLYVTIDGLKVRKQPNLKGEVIATLELYEQVSFLNQKSEKVEEISLGLEKVTDHWVKVRTQSGKDGWVFGAGVHYYKMKRKGVM
jgi:Bacterial SH3 domain